MKLSIIEREHLLKAASKLDAEREDSWAVYFLVIDGKEYPFKLLVRRAYEIAKEEKVNANFFQSNQGYRNFIENKFGYKIVFKIPENVVFFTKEDLEFYSKYAGKQYRKENEEHKVAGRRIKNTIFKKTNFWSRLIDLDEYVLDEDNRWQISGFFKSYSFARIYMPQFKSSNVFFTVGVDGDKKALVYKLDCLYETPKGLSQSQHKSFKRIVDGYDANWQQISLDELENNNWEKLSNKTCEFIQFYTSLYLEAIEAIENPISFPNDRIGSLIEKSYPENAYNELPRKQYLFKGVSIDYDSQNKSVKEIGDAGEEIVMKFERQNLFSKGLIDLANKVRKLKDGEGYDIVSYNEDSSIKYIEVKTTTGIATRPFMMSDNEWEFLSNNFKNYTLYRLYNFDREFNTANFFKISGEHLKDCFKRSKQYEVYIKRLS
jgi:hypothetical protein